VAELRVIDHGMKPVTVSPWDQFSEVETAATAKLAGTFPVAIGIRLATQNSTIFTFNPPIPEATTLQTWCLANASKMKELYLVEPPKSTKIKQRKPKNDNQV
jgi:hypothetical protein